MATRKPSTPIIQVQLKLILRPSQERVLNRWLWHLTGVYNWAVRKIQLDAADRRYWSEYEMCKLVAGTSRRLGIPSHVVRAAAITAHAAWSRCFDRIAKAPRLKGRRNKLGSISFPDPIKPPVGSRITLLGIGPVKFHRQDIPDGDIKGGRVIKRASGWYLALFIDAPARAIPIVGDGAVGLDPGFTSLITLSTGEQIGHPRELEASARRLGQAQRGRRKRLTSRIHERIRNQRKDRNHKVSRRLVSRNALIVCAADGHRAIARRFGKSVTSSSHGELRRMLASKCRAGGREYIEVSPKNTTRMCSACGALSGPTGLAQLSVRHWTCEPCGAAHDRDVNAAVNTLVAGRGLRHERVREGASDIANRATRQRPSPR